MSLVRQGRSFAMVGFAQCLVDWAILVALSHMGIAVVYANLAGRLGGALLGFWLNGRVTFARDDAGPGWPQFLRYAVLWCATAAVSTLVVAHVDAVLGLRWAWLVKPGVDGLLAIASFLVSRHWVYR